jgi:hypothetical protein
MEEIFSASKTLFFQLVGANLQAFPFEVLYATVSR